MEEGIEADPVFPEEDYPISGKKKKGTNKRSYSTVADAGQKATKKPALKRLCRRAGIQRISAESYDAIRTVMGDFMNDIVRVALSRMIDSKATMKGGTGVKTLKENNAIYSLFQNGVKVYGYGNIPIF